MDEKSLSHTSWNCKYHIVLVPKYRRKVIYGKLRKDIGMILRMLCDFKLVEILSSHTMHTLQKVVGSMKQAHTLREYQYYDNDTLCSIIDAVFTTKQFRYLLKERVLTVLLAQQKK